MPKSRCKNPVKNMKWIPFPEAWFSEFKTRTLAGGLVLTNDSEGETMDNEENWLSRWLAVRALDPDTISPYMNHYSWLYSDTILWRKSTIAAREATCRAAQRTGLPPPWLGPSPSTPTQEKSCTLPDSWLRSPPHPSIEKKIYVCVVINKNTHADIL